jgi:hypothetical protein
MYWCRNRTKPDLIVAADPYTLFACHCYECKLSDATADFEGKHAGRASRCPAASWLKLGGLRASLMRFVIPPGWAIRDFRPNLPPIT